MSNQLLIEAFTELAPEYEATVDRELRQFWGLSYQQFIDRLIGITPAGESDRILDVATGTALIPVQMAHKLGAGGRIVGLDLTPAMLRSGQENVRAAHLTSAIDLLCASAVSMPFAPGSFDVVICGLGTHHMDVPHVLAEMRRVLRKGGWLVVADAGASSFWRSFWGRVWLRMLVLRYELTEGRARAQAERAAVPNVRSATEWEALLVENGFAEIEVVQLKPRRTWYPQALMIKAAVV